MPRSPRIRAEACEEAWLVPQGQGQGHSSAEWQTCAEGGFLRALQSPSPLTLPRPAQKPSMAHSPGAPAQLSPSGPAPVLPHLWPLRKPQISRIYLLRFLPSVLRPGRPFLGYLQWADPLLPPVPLLLLPGPVTCVWSHPYRPASVLTLPVPNGQRPVNG